MSKKSIITKANLFSIKRVIKKGLNPRGKKLSLSYDVVQAAIKKMNKRITNEIFLIIQNDRELMKMYLQAIEEEVMCQKNQALGHAKVTVNQIIGKEVKKSYNLTNMDDREDNPSCTLIESHQKFE